jgi:hypothetical protein
MNFSKRKKLIWEQDSQESLENLRARVLLDWLIENDEVLDDTTLDDIEQSDDYYEVPTFEVDRMRFGVGTEYEMEMSAKENISDFIDQECLYSFNTNFFSEFLGTFVLQLGLYSIFHKGTPDLQSHFGTFLVGILVWSLGLSMGGTTGYAINPARDLAPRLVHFLLPIPGKGSSNWQYAWIPILAPLCGSAFAAFLIKL